MKAHEILSDESKWCQFAYARDANKSMAVKTGSGLDELVFLPDARSFCMVAAVYIAQDCRSLLEAKRITQRAIKKTFPLTSWPEGEEFNNHHSFEDVRKVLVENDL